MSEIDIDALASPLSDEEPAGSDLEYDPDFVELERLVAEAEAPADDDIEGGSAEPNWRAIDDLAHDLLQRTRDLRVAAMACRSALQQDGLAGYRQHLGLLRALITNMWEHVHPRLDPDDDNDPTMRMNILSSLTDSMTAITPLRATPIVNSRALGRFGWRDVMIANGELSVPEGEDASVASMSTLNSAFMDADLEELQATTNSIAEALEEVDTIEQTTTEYVGTGAAISLEELRRLLKAMHTGMSTRVAQRSGAEMPDGVSEVSDSMQPGAAQAASGIPGQISSRQDVVAALDRIVAYYRTFEPTSPVPILMQRAKRLANMDFMEIIRDMAPDGVSQIEMIRGEASDSSGGEGYSDDGYENEE